MDTITRRTSNRFVVSQEHFMKKVLPNFTKVTYPEGKHHFDFIIGKAKSHKNEGVIYGEVTYSIVYHSMYEDVEDVLQIWQVEEFGNAKNHPEIIISKPLTIRFLDDNSNTQAEIINPPANYHIPRVGEHFDIHRDGGTQIVISVHHSLHENEILVFFDWYGLYDNNTVERNNVEEDRKPKN